MQDTGGMELRGQAPVKQKQQPNKNFIMWITWKRHMNNMPLYLPDRHLQEELPAEDC
jgi:hypothetical protein